MERPPDHGDRKGFSSKIRGSGVYTKGRRSSRSALSTVIRRMSTGVCKCDKPLGKNWESWWCTLEHTKWNIFKFNISAHRWRAGGTSSAHETPRGGARAVDDAGPTIQCCCDVGAGSEVVSREGEYRAAGRRTAPGRHTHKADFLEFGRRWRSDYTKIYLLCNVEKIWMYVIVTKQNTSLFRFVWVYFPGTFLTI